jgi:hypothetical protein
VASFISLLCAISLDTNGPITFFIFTAAVLAVLFCIKITEVIVKKLASHNIDITTAVKLLLERLSNGRFGSMLQESQCDQIGPIFVYWRLFGIFKIQVFHPIGMVFLPSSHYYYEYKFAILQLLMLVVAFFLA